MTPEPKASKAAKERYALVPCGSGRPGCSVLVLHADGQFVKIDAMKPEREAAEKMAEFIKVGTRCQCGTKPKYECLRCKALAAYESAKGE